MTKMMTTIALALAVAACGGKPTKTDVPANKDRGSAAPVAAAGTAKVVSRVQSGGVLELGSGDRGAAMEDANKQMAAHCGPESYQITSEGEEAVDGGGTVWRVHYQCAGATP